MKRCGVPVIEYMPKVSFRPESGAEHASQWQPYKLWQADLWHCLGCGNMITSGYSDMPYSERHHNDFQTKIETAKLSEYCVHIYDC
jgi:hypothetical protein